jgi:hypothetical protein
MAASVATLRVQMDGQESSSKLNLGLDNRMNETSKMIESLSVQVQNLKNADYESQIEAVQDHLAEVRKNMHFMAVRNDHTPFKVEIVHSKPPTSLTPTEIKKITKQVKGLSK